MAERSFKRSFDSLEEIFRFTGEFFSRERIDRSLQLAVDLAVEEFFTNLVKYHPETRTDVALSLRRDGERLVVRIVADEAEPFDVTREREVPVDGPLAERPVGGLGLHLARKVMDRIDYSHAARRGTITLVKTIG